MKLRIGRKEGRKEERKKQAKNWNVKSDKKDEEIEFKSSENVKNEDREKAE